MTYFNSTVSTPCLDLAMEGERFCREGDWNKGISFLLKALTIGTDDLNCLCVIYCQLGNAYFHQKDYPRALEYHRWNLALTKKMGDRPGEASATGNLGNTLQMLGKYDEAILCFTHELEIARHLNDKTTEAGALYNLGNVYQAKGKQWLPDPGEYPVDAVKAQRKAAEYYKMSLELVRTLGDRPAEGRALGSLANVYYLLSNFTEAIDCYKERLKIAKEYGDLPAQRRAHSNIGNAFIFLADFNSAVEHYREALQLSIHLKDISLQAQACFSLGNTYILLRDPGTAVVFLLRHLVIARGLADRIGEGRAHWSLANAYTALKRYDLALRCSKRHRQIAFELGDNTGFMTAHLMIGGIRCLMKSVQTEFSGVNRDNQTDSQAILSKNSILTRTTSVPSSSSSSSSAGLSHRQQNHILDINTTRLNNKTNNNNNSTCENSTVNLPPNSTNGTVVTLPFSSSSITGTCIIDDNNELKIRPSNSTLDNWINCNNKHGLTPINPSNSTVALTTTTTTTTTPTVSDNSIIKPIVQQIHSQTFQPYIHKPILNDTNHTIDSYDYQVDNDIELDKDLERELLESYEGILETVEFVTVTEDGQTIISQMGCLDVPTPVSSESKKENMVEFYLSTPAFRPNLSQQTDLSNLGDIEENFESIESMSQMNRNPNLPNNDLAYNSNIDSGNTHTTTTTTTTTNTTGTSTVTATATPAATASLVEEGRLVDQQEMFFSLLLESQSRRMDEQRCYLRSSQDTGTIQSTDETVTTNSPQEFIHIQSSENFYHTPDDNNNSPLQSHQLGANEEAFFDLIEGVQGDRMNDQRANLSVFPGLRSGPGLHFFEGGNRYFGSTNSMFKSTSSGASDGLPEPKLFSSNSESVTGLLSDATCCMQKAGSSSGGGEGGTRGRRGHIVVSSTGGGGGGGDLDDEFLEMIFRIQTCTRINDQRSNLPDPLSQLHSQTNPTNHQSDNGNTTHITSQTVVTVSNSHRELISYTSSDVITCNLTNRCSAPAILDDNDDLFALIQRVQSTRLDEQRCYPPLQQSQSSCLSTSLSSTSSCIDRSENTISLDTTSGNIVRKSSGRRRVGSRNSKRTNHQNK